MRLNRPESVRRQCVHMFAMKSMRGCSRCHQERPVGDFAWRRKSEGVRHPYCRKCMAEYNRAHYQANKALYIQRARRRARTVQRERLGYLLEFSGTNHASTAAKPT